MKTDIQGGQETSLGPGEKETKLNPTLYHLHAVRGLEEAACLSPALTFYHFTDQSYEMCCSRSTELFPLGRSEWTLSDI